ncbi:aminotransferase-like domain-containing protein [Sphingobacterium sp. MYb388]|uniref:aminotransferase-like domain-containing protein n=1 Tax=Sphingobacterium sp. MYb388 TaxID=2745437 RepID=UPI0030AE2553
MAGKSFLYEQVARKIEDSISKLNLKGGDKIPSVRTLSKEMAVSMNTVFQAYSILEAKGLIISRPRSGYIINTVPDAIRNSNKNLKPAIPASVEITSMATAMMKNAKENGIINFSILAPVNEYLPLTKLNKAVNASLTHLSSDNFQYPLVDGHPRLLMQIARRTMEWNVSLAIDDIVVTNGCMEAINLCLDAVTKSGDIVAVESPTYHGILQSLESRGLKALEIATDPVTGLSIPALKEALSIHQIVACIFMPTCHNPTGACMPDTEKIELVRILGEENIPLIEDDSLGELNFKTSRSLPAKAFDTYNNVMYCSSFSKTLAPGFRIGWVSAGKNQSQLEKLKFGSNISTNPVLQDAIGRYLESGHYDSHIRKLGIELQGQMMKYLSAIATYFPKEIRLSVPQGGLSIWIELPENRDAFVLQQEALSKGIGICPGHIFSTSDFYHHYIRINYCPLWSNKTENAIITIGKLI